MPPPADGTMLTRQHTELARQQPGVAMAAIDDLTELVERAAAAERSALASKWKDRDDVEATIRRARKSAEEQRAAVRLEQRAESLSPRWAGLRQNYLDLGAQQPVESGGDAVTHAAAAQAEA